MSFEDRLSADMEKTTLYLGLFFKIHFFNFFYHFLESSKIHTCPKTQVTFSFYLLV